MSDQHRSLSKYVTKEGPEDSADHQLCNIQINELKRYSSQLEEENLSLVKRLKEQIAISDELEKTNTSDNFSQDLMALCFRILRVGCCILQH